MATRTFCDHCGNTVKTPNIFCYGPHQAVKNEVNAAFNAMHSSHIGQMQIAGRATNNPALMMPELTQIDLCDTCVRVWMNRVTALTKTSDV